MRLVSGLAFASVGGALFLALRTSRGPVVAAVAALALVWFRHMTLEPAVLNLYLSVTGGVTCAYLLSRPSTRRRDLALAVALGFSLCSAGSGVAVAAACVLHLAVTRARWQRWVSVALPSAAWALWWLLYGSRAEPAANAKTPEGPWDLISAVWSNVVGSFQQLALGNRLAGVALLIVFVGWGFVLGRGGLARAAGVLAWSAALLVWWVGLAISRGTNAIASEQFRYAYVAGAFIVMALVPAGSRGEAAGPSNSVSRWAARAPTSVAVGVVLAVAALLALAVRDDERRSSDDLARAACQVRSSVAAVDRRPAVVGDDATMPIFMYLLRAEQVRTLTDAYGHPFGRGPEAATAAAAGCDR